jgi:hypothetical protein
VRISRRVTVAGVIVACVALAGIAFALWSANGTGGASAKALVAQTATVDAATGPADLYPGGPPGAVHFTLTNANPYAVSFDTISAATVTDVTGGIGGSPACTTADLTVSALPITGFTPVTVAGNATSAQQGISGVVAMTSTAPDACQDAVFTISLTLTGSQV